MESISNRKTTAKTVQKKRTLKVVGKVKHKDQKISYDLYQHGAMVRNLIKTTFNDGNGLSYHKKDIIKTIGLDNYKKHKFISQLMRDMKQGRIVYQSFKQVKESTLIKETPRFKIAFTQFDKSTASTEDDYKTDDEQVIRASIGCTQSLWLGCSAYLQAKRLINSTASTPAQISDSFNKLCAFADHAKIHPIGYLFQHYLMTKWCSYECAPIEVFHNGAQIDWLQRAQEIRDLKTDELLDMYKLANPTWYTIVPEPFARFLNRPTGSRIEWWIVLDKFISKQKPMEISWKHFIAGADEQISQKATEDFIEIHTMNARRIAMQSTISKQFLARQLLGSAGALQFDIIDA